MEVPCSPGVCGSCWVLLVFSQHCEVVLDCGLSEFFRVFSYTDGPQVGSKRETGGATADVLGECWT